MPAFYWDVVGFELEYPVTTSFTVGVNMLRKFGRTDGGSNKVFKIRPENFQDANTSLEFALKFYLPYDMLKAKRDIGRNAPVGLYIQGNLSYNSLLFFDGTNRPYTMHSNWKDTKGLRDPNELDKPSDISFGGGVGFQAIVIPGHIIANVMLGTQVYFPKVLPGFYVSPSIGYIF